MPTAKEIKQWEVLERQFAIAQWDIMETMQEAEPYLTFGWYGFIPMVILSDNC